jgi:hypothetical protein
MSREKLRIYNTDLNNLVANLRGEIGEIFFSWVLMRDLSGMIRELSHGTWQGGQPDVNELVKELSDPRLNTLYVLVDKLEDDIVARLSELADSKIGRLTFYFASQKLRRLEVEVQAFARFIEREKFTQKRNWNISHKELPEKWADHHYITIPYPTIVRGIAMAVRLMKRIDDMAVGPEASFFGADCERDVTSEQCGQKCCT